MRKPDQVSIEKLRPYAVYERRMGSAPTGDLTIFLVTYENTGYLNWRIDCFDGEEPFGCVMLGYSPVREDAIERIVQAVLAEQVDRTKEGKPNE